MDAAGRGRKKTESTEPFYWERERRLLAAYGFPSAATRGRRYDEPPHAYRGPFQRDRDRIVHSAAFRRLSGKMQVFTGDMGDYHRTRLTHTMEVTSIARTMGRALGLNEDLIEALALVHDIGHPPFGHAGEDALDACLENEGGFSHNQFALTLVEELEKRYHGFAGLNLSFEILDGQTSRTRKGDTARSPLLEGQVVDMADSIAYDAHDIDDAVELGLFALEELHELPLIVDVERQVHQRFPNLDPAYRRPALVHQLINLFVTSVLERSSDFLSTCGWEDHQPALRQPPIIRMDATLEHEKRRLEKFLYQRVYRHPQLLEVRQTAQDKLRRMVEHYANHVSALPPSFQHRADRIGDRQAAAEYLAGMTDRFCLRAYHELFGDD